MTSKKGTERSGRQPLFYVVAVLIPFLFLGAAEGLLRLTGTGARSPLFVAGPVAGYLQPNEAVIERYFAKADQAPDVSIDTSYFLEQRPPDSLRVVVQGGSSAAGFPYGRMASPAGMLQQRLERAFPGRTVEIINTAMSAVNSYTLLDFADEIIAIEPDAVVIYAGHNEFIGVLGVGSAYSSSLSPGLTRLVLALRRLHLVEAGFRLYGAFLPTQDRPPGTLMSRVARERRIPYEGDVFTAGQAQFRENLALLLEKYREHGIPVFIGTLAANEKDQPPFISADPPHEAAAWREARQIVETSLASGDAAGAVLAADRLVELVPESATTWYLLGKARLAGGRPEVGRQAFLRAKDLDELRFRAPESFNDIIRETADRHGAVLVDVQSALATRSPAGTIGGELMLEHLHPNVDGYFYLGSAFFDAVVGSTVLGPPDRDIDATTARAEIPLTEVDRLHGEWRIQRLLNDWPFVEETIPYTPPEPATEIERIARDWYDGRATWVETMNRALGHYSARGDMRETIRVAATMAMAFPFEPDPAYIAGSALLSEEDVERALPFLYRAANLEPGNTRYLMSLAQGFYLSDRPRDSLAVMERVMKIEPRHPTAPKFMDKVRGELEPEG